MSDVFVARQPIYDRRYNVVAYELLFRNADTSAAPAVDGDHATASVLTNTFVDIGVEAVCGNRPAYVNFTRAFLDGEFPVAVEPSQVVIEVLETIAVNEKLLASLRKLKDDGFRIALDDFTLTPKSRPLLNLADIVKLDIQAQPRQQLRRTIDQIRRGWKVTLLAEKIETNDEFTACMTEGFELFQGYFLSRPRIIQGTKLPKNRLALLQLLAALQDPQVSFKDLEKLICQNVGLAVRVLQSVNSSSFGLVNHIDSVHQALVLLGLARVRNLASLALLANIDDAPPALLGMALIRAKMCEELGKLLNGNRDSYFTVGLLSTLDLFLQRPLEEVLRTMPLTDDVLAALQEFEGGMGAALRCALDYERGEYNSANCLSLSASDVWQCFIEAVKAVEGPGGLLQANHINRASQPAPATLQPAASHPVLSAARR